MPRDKCRSCRMPWNKHSLVLGLCPYCRKSEEMQTCTNPDMHAKYAERGIEDQCPHCLIKYSPERLL